MFRHIVLMKWKPETPAAVPAALDAALAELHRRTPSLLAYTYGADAGRATGAWDYGVVADFADEGAYLEFRDDPGHRSVIDRCIAPWRDRRVSVQLDLGPSLGDRDYEPR